MPHVDNIGNLVARSRRIKATSRSPFAVDRSNRAPRPSGIRVTAAASARRSATLIDAQTPAPARIIALRAAPELTRDLRPAHVSLAKRRDLIAVDVDGTCSADSERFTELSERAPDR